MLGIDDPVMLDGDFSEEAGIAAGRQLAASDVDGVFSANDMMAIGCIASLTEAGRNVPDDVAVVGFDDVPIARYVTPALSTMRVHIAELGERALERLVQTIEADAETNIDVELTRARTRRSGVEPTWGQDKIDNNPGRPGKQGE